MKSFGFETKFLDFTAFGENTDSFPSELSLWGSFENFQKLNVTGLKIKAFLLYYYGDLAAGLIFYEKRYGKVLKVGYSPDPNISVPFGHVYIKQQDSQRAQEQLLEKFVSELTKMINKEKYINFTIALPPEILDVREFFWNKWAIKPGYTYMLDLKKIAKHGLSQYVGKKIRNIVKQTKRDLTIKSIKAEELFSCYKETYIRQGKKPAKTASYFKVLQTLNSVSFIGAFQNKKLTSAIAVCEDGAIGRFLTSGSKNDFYNNNGIIHLLYNYLELLIEKKNSTIFSFDFVGANSKQVSYFKSNFNPTIVQYFIVQRKNLLTSIIEKILTKII